MCGGRHAPSPKKGRPVLPKVIDPNLLKKRNVGEQENGAALGNLSSPPRVNNPARPRNGQNEPSH